MLSLVYTPACIRGYLFNDIRKQLIETSMCSDHILLFGIDLCKDYRSLRKKFLYKIAESFFFPAIFEMRAEHIVTVRLLPHKRHQVICT